MSSASSSVTSAPVRLTGRVKWFNNKTGFGFISVVGGNDQFKDASEIFVHHSAVTVSQEQYRYLVEGEYVEFSVVVTETGAHKFQAGDVRGVKGGKLFCETRREHRVAQDGASGSREHQQPHQHQQRHQDGQSSRGGGGGGSTRGGRVMGGRGGYDRNGESGGEWMLVRRGHTGDRPPYRPRQQRPERTERTERTERPERHTQKHEQEHEASPNTSTQSPAPVETPATATSSSDVQSTPRTASSKKPRQTKPSF